MRKRTLCLLLSAYLLIGLAGCGENSSLDSPNPSGTLNTSDTSSPSDTSSILAEEPIVEEVLPDPAEVFVDRLTTEQQLAQMFFVRCPDVDAVTLVQEHAIGGYILFSRDFEGQTPDSVRATVQSYQEAAAIPLLMGVDEEGGTVVRISSNPAFRATRFRSPQALYQEGGFDEIQQDTQEKDTLLQGVGLNVNLAPVCDLSTDPNDFIYSRAFGQEAELTSTYVQTVVEQMQQDHIGAVLKHFPGYGNNADTHTGIAIDERPLDTFQNHDFKPFQAGITAGAGAVMVSHNVVKAIDANEPASLSPAVHQMLREELGFTGVIMTDDLMMDAITQYTDGEDAAVLAVLAGNDMLISSDFAAQYQAILTAVESGTIAPAQIRESAMRVIRWKMQIGLIPETVSEEAGTVTGTQSRVTNPSRNVIRPRNAIQSKSVTQPVDVTPSGDTVQPSNVTPSGDTVQPSNATPSGDTVQPSNITPSGDTVQPSNVTPSGNTVQPSNATPSGDTVQPNNATPSGNTVRSSEATTSSDTVRSSNATKSPRKTQQNKKSTGIGGSTHHTRRRAHR